MPDAALPCPRCGDAMQHRALAAHLGRTVEVDHCSTCRLMWFDTLESVQLALLGWVELLRELQVGSGLALPAAGAATPARPHCASAFNTLHNRTGYGAFAARECPRGHGHLHTRDACRTRPGARAAGGRDCCSQGTCTPMSTASACTPPYGWKHTTASGSNRCVPLRHPPGAIGRAGADQCRRPVELKLKTPCRDETMHLDMSPLEFIQRLAARVPRPRLHPSRTASRPQVSAIGRRIWVSSRH